MRLFFFPLLCLLALPALAQVTYVRLTAGTGFFINREGHVITNAHVVRNCRSIAVNNKPAQLVALDGERDLAVLKVPGPISAIAPLRWNIKDLRPGDSVVVMGFPGAEGAQGHSRFVKTTIVGLQGPTGEPLWLQLASVAQKGNSGGPVLDTTGNVIAVVSGTAQTYKVDTSGSRAPELVGKADIAITLSALTAFLDQKQIPFYQAASGLVAYADPILQQNASRFIVPVQCLLG